MTEERIPTTEKLVQALTQAGAPKAMIEKARGGYYDDYKSDLALPIHQLVQDAYAVGLTDIAMRAIDGQFDAQRWEAIEWGNSPEAKAIFAEFIAPPGPNRKQRRWRK